jgi:membrane-associated phospholipid phosphatase
VADLLALESKQALVEDLTVFFQVIAVNATFTNLAKYTVQRPIPLAYSNPHDPSITGSKLNYDSFYSLHTSTTFAALTATAMTVNRRYQTGAWPFVAAAVIGGSVAYERVAGGRHFPTDVMMGALAGATVGILIPYLHFRRDEGAKVSVLAAGDRIGVSWRLLL